MRRSSSSTSRPRAASRPTNSTVSPARARPRPTARPIPPVPPVTSDVRVSEANPSSVPGSGSGVAAVRWSVPCAAVSISSSGVPSSRERRHVDLLSAVLRELRFENAGYRQLELRAPWAISFAQADLRGMHLVLAGACELALGDEPVLRLGPGDLVLATRADPHVLRSPGARVRPMPSTELAQPSPGGTLRAGGGGERTSVLCGAFLVGNAAHPALAGLPRIVHVPAEAGGAEWLAAFHHLLEVEGKDSGPGSALVISRLSDALLARALRFEVDRIGESGWLRALRDPELARA